MTTVVPLLIMLAVNYGVLRHKLNLLPLKFLRRDLSGKKQHRAVHLSPRIRFFQRFRLRVIFQNVGNYIVLLIGILFTNLILMFGLLLPSTLDHYQKEVQENLLANYQYILSVPVSAVSGSRIDEAFALLDFYLGTRTDNEDAEQFSAYELNTAEDGYKSEEILLYGVDPKSSYIQADFSEDGVWVSSAYADKYLLKEGDTITLKEKYEDDVYSFQVAGIYDYTASLCVFMKQQQLNETFDLGDRVFQRLFFRYADHRYQRKIHRFGA